MSLANRSLVIVDDLTNSEIEAVFSVADEMAESMAKQSGLCQGKTSDAAIRRVTAPSRTENTALVPPPARYAIRVLSGDHSNSVSLSRPGPATTRVVRRASACPVSACAENT